MRPRSKLSGSTNLYPAQISEGGGLGEIYFFFFQDFLGWGFIPTCMKLVKSEKPCKNVENIDKSENSETIEMSKSVKGKTKMLPWGRSVESSTTPRQKWHICTWYLKRDPVGGIKRATYQGGQIWRHPAIQTSCPDGECWWQPVLIQDFRLHC